GKGYSSGGTVWIGQVDQSAPLAVTVTPLGRSHASRAQLPGAYRAAAFLARRTGAADVQGRLRIQFGLTAADARVALALLDGVNASQIAQRLGVRRETVRTQIKAVYGKTGVRRQGQFIALALSHPPGIS